MSAYARLQLSLDTYCDYQQTFTFLASSQAVGLVVASAVLTIANNPETPTSLLQLTTSASSSGQLIFGVACPSPVGATCSNLAELVALGSGSLTSGPPVPPAVGETSTLTSLAAYVTTGLVVGDAVFVQAGRGSYYAWSPLDPNTPNGQAVIASTSATGNWLLCGTVTITIAACAVAPALVGTYWNLLVTWSNGTTSKLFAGEVEVSQSLVAPT
jgi:hypothetical protein